MTDTIFLINQDKTLQPMISKAYDNEMLLQELIVAYPDLLAGYQISPEDPRRWVLVKKEIGIPGEENASDRWSLDHLFLDQDGTPTLVEVKRATDTRIRREVVGQMLDYAANAILYWPVDKLRRLFDATCEANEITSSQAIADLLGILTDDEYAIESFWTTVENKLKAGQIRLLFVADKIPVELRRIIEFLNEKMPDVEVLGVEVPQFTGSDLAIVTPRVIGQTVAAERSKTKSATRQWDEDSFFESLTEKHGSAAADGARRLLDWAVQEEKFNVKFGSGSHGSVMLKYGQTSLLNVYDYKTEPRIELQLITLASISPFHNDAKRMELISRLNLVEGIHLSPDMLHGKRPSVSLALLLPEESFNRFTDTYDWVLDEIGGTT